MVVLFQKSVYPIAVIILGFLCSCHSLPPAEPLAEQEEFDPRILPWQKVSMPTDLLGDWYTEGDLYLSVTEEDFRAEGVLAIFQSISKSDSYYRIIYRIAQKYHAIYLRNLTNEEVQIVHADSTAVDEEGASAVPVSRNWLTLTATNPWIPTMITTDITGNWHIQDGMMEVVIEKEKVVLDGESWEIDSIQTNRHVDRFILKRDENYKSFYFQEVGSYTIEALLVDGKEDIQNRYGNIPGDWYTLYRWWDFIDACRLYPGSRWSYDFYYWKIINEVDNTSSPRDSILQSDSLKGQFELEVTNSTIDEGTGSLTLKATFKIDEEKGIYFHYQVNGDVQIVTDSSWSVSDFTIIEQYEIILENDTLWYNTDEGKVFFASTKVKPNARVIIRAFVYPFDFPEEIFSMGININAGIQFPGIEPSFGADRLASFVQGEGFKYIYYSDCTSIIPLKEISFRCDMKSFTPGS